MWRGGPGAGGEGFRSHICRGLLYASRRWCEWWGRRGRWGRGWVGIAAAAWTALKR